MRFLILTLYYRNYNFGGLLQAYALQHVIEAQKTDCKVLSYQFRKDKKKIRHHRRQEIHKKFSNNFLSGIYFIIFKTIWKIFRYIINILHRKSLIKRQSYFKKFAGLIPHSGKIYNTSQLKDCVNLYDGFICGGDQIWNNWGHYADGAIQGFTLEFVPDNKIKFSYAPSTGTVSHEKEFSEQLKPGLKRLDYISVRERSSIPYIEKLSGKKAEAVLDPVMLLDRGQWDKVVKEYAHIEFIGSVQNWSDIGFGDIRMFAAGPLEFVKLIQCAEMVLTDSFHGSVFSIIFEKDFYVFERDMKVGNKDMNIRIDDLLGEFGLSHRKVQAEALLNINDTISIEPINYEHVSKVLAKRREESMEYLIKGLKEKKHGTE